MKDDSLIYLNDKELAEVITKAQEILTARRNAQKEEDWCKVVNAICEYQEKYGDICVEDGSGCVWIDSKCDFSTIGEICLAWTN